MNERQIFEGALEFENPVDRRAFLDKACGADVALRASVDALLVAHDATSQFLNTPAVEQMQGIDKRLDRTLDHSVAKPNDEIDIDEGSEGPDLSFLQPSNKPGSIGSLGHYEILQVLGQGAFGVVFRAFDEKLHRQVAVKAMNPQLAATSPPRKRFLREARSVAAIKHENIVQIYSVEEQPLPYLVMEFVQGQTLQQKLAGSGPLELFELLHLGHQMAAGLAAAHAIGLIHRDIKPANILLERGSEQKVKITDFGLARTVDDASMTQSGVIAGTPLYMSPEQAEGRTLDERSDLFSLGSVLYQMTTGRPAFRAANTIAVLRRVVADAPRSLSEVIATTPPWLETIVMKLLEKEPNNRFASAKEVADLLARCQRELQVDGMVTCVAELTLQRGQRSEADIPTLQLPSRLLKPTAAKPRNPLFVAMPAILATLLLGLYITNRIIDRWNSAAASNANSPANISASLVPSDRPSWHEWPADAPAPAIAPFNSTQAKQYQEAWASYLKLPIEYENSVGMKLIFIPPGEFLMGSTKEEVERLVKEVSPPHEYWADVLRREAPQRRIVLPQPFYLAATEVTRQQFEAVMGVPALPPTEGKGGGFKPADLPNLPVEGLNWKEALDLCARLSEAEGLQPSFIRDDNSLTRTNGNGYILPTSARWEFACRAGTTTRFWTGAEPTTINQAAWTYDNSNLHPHPVAILRANAFGMHDMIGNVWEWCQDTAETQGDLIDPTGDSAVISSRIARGSDFEHGPVDRFGRSAVLRHWLTHEKQPGLRVMISIEGVRHALRQKASRSVGE